MPKVKEKKQKKQRTKKQKLIRALQIIVCAVIVLAVVSKVFIFATTRPADVNDENVIYVGGMVTDENLEYKSEASKGIEKNPVIQLMQMVWRFCDGGDKAKHAEQTPPDNITEIADIPYLDDGNHYHLLDVMYPDDTKPTDKLPVIIDIHGGGWMYADKDLNDYYCMSLASRGYVVFNISYRLVPDVTVGEQIQDCANALSWISENMQNYPCDVENITLTGDSAGGQLAVYSSVIMQSPELQKVFDTADPNLDVDSLLLTSPVPFMKDGGAFSVYTKTLWGKDYKDNETYNYMDLSEIIDYAPEMPKTYLITSSGDSLANAQTHKAYDLLKEKGYECEMVDYDKEQFDANLPHVFSVINPFDEAGTSAIDSALDYLQN